MSKKIVIYTTPTCAFCKMAKEYFEEHNLAYQEIDVSTDLAAQQEMIEKSGQMGVPVILIDDEVIIGFDKERIEDLLKTDKQTPQDTPETA